MNEQQLSERIEHLLVARNLRQMQTARAALVPGYYLRAAQHLRDLTGTVIIATGFPVASTFETDGPVGAIALYNALQTLGAQPVIACSAPLSNALMSHYRVLDLSARNIDDAHAEARYHLNLLQPQALVAIERPGLADDGRYYNMRGEDITEHCIFFDPFIIQADCPTIAIGDGGNEIGMGNIASTLAGLDIRAAVTGCDELLVADVSNWGAYGLIALLAHWARRDLLAAVDPAPTLQFLVARGSVDGVTRASTLTEDGLDLREGQSIIAQLRALSHISDNRYRE
jgi:hypothetical protein